jgi:DNA-3-methyladenine glycosylase
MITKLPVSFFERPDVARIAQELLGKLLVTQINGIQTSGRIVETEAYNGIVDKASHAYKGRRTPRTEIMYRSGGTAYVYLCYGIHHLFNVVTNTAEIPHAVLVRAIEPVQGIEHMLVRMKKKQLDFSVGRGPGNVSKALGISTLHTGTSLIIEAPDSSEISIWKDDFRIKKTDITASPRIGVDYAAEDAALPYRFYLRNNKYVSGKKS